jgi:hypothetical protein
MTNLVWCHSGDSISGCAGRWPFQYLATPSRGDCGNPIVQNSAFYVVGNILFLNMAISGTKLTGANGSNTVASTYIDPILQAKNTQLISDGKGTSKLTKRKYLYSCGIGSNDAATGGLANATAYANAVAANAQARRTAGADLIALCTLLPRDDATMTEPNRLEYNSNLTNASWRLANGIDYVFDLAADPVMGVFANCSNITYYQADKVHPQDLGSGLIATNQVTPVMNTILASL